MKIVYTADQIKGMANNWRLGNGAPTLVAMLDQAVEQEERIIELTQRVTMLEDELRHSQHAERMQQRENEAFQSDLNDALENAKILETEVLNLRKTLMKRNDEGKARG